MMTPMKAVTPRRGKASPDLMRPPPDETALCRCNRRNPGAGDQWRRLKMLVESSYCHACESARVKK
jgi:hypothetical protein